MTRFDKVTTGRLVLYLVPLITKINTFHVSRISVYLNIGQENYGTEPFEGKPPQYGLFTMCIVSYL